MQKITVTVLLVLVVASSVQCRWLPTRGQDDRLDRLREMLKELLESEIDKTNFDRRAVFKREIGPSPMYPQPERLPEAPLSQLNH